MVMILTLSILRGIPLILGIMQHGLVKSIVKGDPPILAVISIKRVMLLQEISGEYCVHCIGDFPHSSGKLHEIQIVALATFIRVKKKSKC